MECSVDVDHNAEMIIIPCNEVYYIHNIYMKDNEEFVCFLGDSDDFSKTVFNVIICIQHLCLLPKF